MEKNDKIRIYFVIFVIFLIGIFIGFILGLSQGPKSQSSERELLLKENSELKAKLEKANFPEIPEMLSVSGTVKSVSAGKIVIEPRNTPAPFESLPQSMEILVSNNTKIVRIEEKEKSRYDVEYKNYLDNRQSGSADIYPPSTVIEVGIRLEDLKIGDIITAFSDQDIKGSQSFEAVEIELNKAQLP